MRKKTGMNYWLLKSEPETWSWQNQVSKGKRGEQWDGVRNYQAAKFLKMMKKGDQAFFYHSGKEKAVVGIVEVIKEAYPDPTDETGKFVAVTVIAVEALRQSVSLTEIKQHPKLQEMRLVKQSRLSVMPVSNSEWSTILMLAK